MRLRYGIRPAEAALALERTRFVITIDQPGPWYGAAGFLSPTLDGCDLEVLPLAQVGFRRPPHLGSWAWIAESESSPFLVETLRDS